MRNQLTHWFSLSLGALILLAGCGVQVPHSAARNEALPPPADVYKAGPVLHHDLLNDLSQWKIEAEQPGRISASAGTLTLDVPRGCTVWFTRELSGPVLIEYDARMVRSDPPGTNDRVSDLNCFWMATDPRNPADFFSVPARTGAFATYNQMLTYYVGQGGNTNTTTRFRRYIGDVASRPLLPEHDLSDAANLLTPNTWQHLQLVAAGMFIAYYRDGTCVFQYNDPHPYTHGYFGIRTTQNHMEVKNLRILRLILPGPQRP